MPTIYKLTKQPDFSDQLKEKLCNAVADFIDKSGASVGQVVQYTGEGSRSIRNILYRKHELVSFKLLFNVADKLGMNIKLKV